MGLRQFLESNRAVGIAVVVIVIIFAAWLALRSTQQIDVSPKDSAYFYDTRTSTLIVLPSNTPTPTQTDDGGTALRAYVFGCDDCSAGDRQITYVEKLAAAAQAALSQLDTTKPQTIDAMEKAFAVGQFVAPPPAARY